MNVIFKKVEIKFGGFTYSCQFELRLQVGVFVGSGLCGSSGQGGYFES